MRQNDGRCLCRQRLFHHFPDRNTRGVDAAFAQLQTAKRLAFGIQAQQIHLLHTAADEEILQILTALIEGIQDHILLGSVYHVESCGRGDHLQKQSRFLTDALHLFQFLQRRIQHLRKGLKPFQQSVCNGIGILAGNDIKQQQLQHLNVRKAVQSVFPETGLQSGAVILMNGFVRHIFSPRKGVNPCYFLIFPLK